MSERLVEGIWDCPYCNATSIGGLQKYCPNCGHPQDKDTKFRLGEKKRYLSDDEVNKVGTEPDWCCDYCSSLNNAKFIYCSNCGASRDKESKDYFDLHNQEQSVKKSETTTEKIEIDDSFEEENDDSFEKEISSDNEMYHQEEEKVKRKSILDYKMFKSIADIVLCLSLVLGLVWGIVLLLTPREYIGTINSKSWERNIEIKEYKTLNESGWTLPSSARLQYTRQEIQSYEQVLDHYETKTRQVPYQVQDGYDISYSDNGNGTFTEHKTPKYRTEYKTETYEEPVYRDEPVYATKYYYKIDRWCHGRNIHTSGSTDEPYWGEVSLNNKEREGNRSETYKITILVKKGNDKNKTYKYRPSLKEWNSYEIKQKVKITVRAGIVIDVDVINN